MQDFALVSKITNLTKSQIQHSVLQKVLIIEIDISGVDVVELQVIEVHLELSLQLICGILPGFSPANSSCSRSFFSSRFSARSFLLLFNLLPFLICQCTQL